VVKDGTHKQSNESFAIKIVTKAKLTKEDEDALKDEILVLRELKHRHIIRLYDVFEEPQYYYLVTEKMSGGELFDRIVQKSYYNEKEARDVCKILFEALGFCHSHQVAHRDLKPENLLLFVSQQTNNNKLRPQHLATTRLSLQLVSHSCPSNHPTQKNQPPHISSSCQSEHNDSDIKIADFGFAKKVKVPNSLTTQCGTPGYVAPEILEGVPYDQKADMWSLGVIVYILLGGYPPFIEQNQRDLFRKIRKGQYEFHDEYWGQVSSDAKDLISSLLTVSPARRLSADAALRNKWISSDGAALAAKDLQKNLNEFKRFNAKRKFKGAVKAVIASNKITSLGENFKMNLD
jgi:serine/threonine protein kinase